jgi:hypothetical protein
MAAWRGHRWTGSESPWFDVFLVGVLMVDMVVEGVLAIVDRIRRVAGYGRDDPVLRATSRVSPREPSP